MNVKHLKKIGLGAIALVVIGSGAVSLQSAAAGALSASTATTSQTRLSTLISKGDQEISRRLTTLSTLIAKINAATKLSASDKTTLTNEVSTTTEDLTSLKAKLDAETTLTDAHTDVMGMYTEYRVYALVAPKVALVKVADDQQVVESRLTTLAQKLQARLSADQQAGKDVAALQAQLRDMTSKTAAAQAVSSGMEAHVVNLEPTDYNNDHTILSGDRDQLKSAHEDNKAAFADAKAIVAGIKNL